MCTELEKAEASICGYIRCGCISQIARLVEIEVVDEMKPRVGVSCVCQPRHSLRPLLRLPQPHYPVIHSLQVLGELRALPIDFAKVQQASQTGNHSVQWRPYRVLLSGTPKRVVADSLKSLQAFDTIKAQIGHAPFSLIELSVASVIMAGPVAAVPFLLHRCVVGNHKKNPLNSSGFSRQESPCCSFCTVQCALCGSESSTSQ